MAGLHPGRPAQDSAGKPSETAAVRQSKDSTDHHFVLEASVGGLTEVRLGKMAQHRAASQKVKDLGERLATDHSKANDELAAAAKKDGIPTAETTLEAKQKGQIDRLAGLSGKNFDSAYLRTMLRDHQEAVQAFQQEASSGESEHVKKFAAKTLPTLERHLTMVQKLAESMGVDTTASSSSASQ
jgi:putative membrane protein